MHRAPLEMRIRSFEILLRRRDKANPRCPGRRRFAYTASRAAAWCVQGAGRDRAPQYRSAGRVSRPLIAVVPSATSRICARRCRGHGLQSSAATVTVSAIVVVSPIGALHRHAHDRPGLQIDRVLGLVRQMRAAILHFRDARVGVADAASRYCALLRALAGAPSPCRSRCPTPVRAVSETPDTSRRNRAGRCWQRRVRLKRRRGLPLDQICGCQHLSR